MSAPTSTTWVYLERKPGSEYRQLFVKEKNIAARTLYGQYMSEGAPLTLEEIAVDWNLPMDAVLEAMAYCSIDPPEILQDWEAEEALMEASGMNDPNYKLHGKP